MPHRIRLLSILALCFVFLPFLDASQQSDASKASVFPDTNTYSLDKAKVNFPADFEGKANLLLISFEPERAVSEKLAVRWWDFLFYALFGLVVTSFVQIGGVLLVFSYLIVPAVCANFLARKLSSLLAIGWVTCTVSSVIGLYVAYQFNYPTGAAVVCVLGAALVLVSIAAWLIAKRKARSQP